MDLILKFLFKFVKHEIEKQNITVTPAGIDCRGVYGRFRNHQLGPNKLYEVNLQSIFPGTVYKTMNAISELNNNRMWSYSRYITNVAFQTPWNERGDGFYRKFYVEILRDLEELAKAYDDGSLPNSLAVVKTWKAFTYYQLLSLYGPVGLSHAVWTEERTNVSLTMIRKPMLTIPFWVGWIRQSMSSMNHLLIRF